VMYNREVGFWSLVTITRRERIYTHNNPQHDLPCTVSININ
jgi:hypothetical protein